jgi:AMMECR1 domain-containing protein
VEARRPRGVMNHADEEEACRIARRALWSYLFEGAVDAGPDIAPAGLIAPAAVFVSLWSGRELRGCMGTINPVARSAAKEIAWVALQTATNDPCRAPLHASELEMLRVGVSLLAGSRPLTGDEHPRKDEGLRVEGPGGLAGFVLPGCGGEAEARAAAGISLPEVESRHGVRVRAFGPQPGDRQ